MRSVFYLILILIYGQTFAAGQDNKIKSTTFGPEIVVGMTEKQVSSKLGAPNIKTVRRDSRGDIVEWHYRKTRQMGYTTKVELKIVTFKNGVVTSFYTSKDR
jgi:hypothetical protein